ncbi:hypothetical protein TRFO_14321 [Tritrichomonas foetus]|uniref:Uncharacterized protein n=1 Tax=Tritrichomonas foetus TaxID=1144522 RepID=A0A1J4KV95_9EUKA|nr:hypothetical protein TRFO_14321 [Tritrichomonas foetus]|eukprot:OHT15155.1 hypothetical protein TRFO_14321 [Tritrichomonas foetus]
MIIFLFSLHVNAENFNYSLYGYYSQDIHVGDIISIMPEVRSKTIFLFPDPNISITFENSFESGEIKSFNIKGEHGVGVSGQKSKIVSSTINSSINFNMKLWIIPENICTESLILYTTTKYLSHYISLNKEIKNTCLFFMNPNEADFHLTIGGVTNTDSKMYAYTASKPNIKSDNCYEKICYHYFTEPFFVSLLNLGVSTSLELSIDFINKYETNDCEGVSLPLYDGNSTTMYSIQARSNIISCNHDFRQNNTPILAFVSLAGLIVLTISMLFICGCFKSCQDSVRWLIGPDISIQEGFLEELHVLDGETRIDISEEDENDEIHTDDENEDIDSDQV